MKKKKTRIIRKVVKIIHLHHQIQERNGSANAANRGLTNDQQVQDVSIDNE
jgi:hypothetical protein